MALFRWRGATSAAWATDSNWLDETGTPYGAGRYPGSVALTYDDVIFDAAATNAVVAYDAPGAADEVLRSFRVTTAFDKAIGTVGPNTWLDIEVSHDTDPQTEDSEVIIEADNATPIMLRGGGTSGLLRGTVLGTQSSGSLHLDEKIGDLAILKGTVVLQGTAVVSGSLMTSYISAQTTDVSLNIEAAATIPAIVNAFGGQITCLRGVTTLNLRGGIWTQAAGNITTVNMGGNTPKLVWEEGNIETAAITAGCLDGSSESAVGRQLTYAYVYPDGKLDLGDDLQNNTIAVGGFIQIWGGTVVWGKGQKVLPIP